MAKLPLMVQPVSVAVPLPWMDTPPTPLAVLPLMMQLVSMEVLVVLSTPPPYWLA